jgi:hypothetical protein
VGRLLGHQQCCIRSLCTSGQDEAHGDPVLSTSTSENNRLLAGPPSRPPGYCHHRACLAVGRLCASVRHPAGEVTRGRSGLAKVFLGSVADKEVRGATVPVLLQRPAAG